MAGTLFVVATPIGNLEDVSFRALRTLREVDLIAAEDTRRTAKLLAHYEIHRPMVSLHAHNEHRETPRLIARLEAGESIALVSDAGTPGIADPGAHLVAAAHQHGIVVSPIPGPSAVMAALSASGLDASEFVFMGFPPRSGSARRAWFDRLVGDQRTTVVFEAPHRIAETLRSLTEQLAYRPIIVYRELTKKYEELVIKQNNTPAPAPKALGEFAIVIGKSSREQAEPQEAAAALDTALRIFGCMTINGAFGLDEAITLAASATSVDPRALQKAIKKERIRQKQARAAHS